MTDNTKGLATDLPEGLVTEPEFHLGETVEKIKGYKLPGVVVAKFYNLKGQLRYVVECTVPEVAGLLHIYSGKDLQRRYNPALCLPDGDTEDDGSECYLRLDTVQDAVRVMAEAIELMISEIPAPDDYLRRGLVCGYTARQMAGILKAREALSHPSVRKILQGEG